MIKKIGDLTLNDIYKICSAGVSCRQCIRKYPLGIFLTANEEKAQKTGMLCNILLGDKIIPSRDWNEDYLNIEIEGEIKND